MKHCFAQASSRRLEDRGGDGGSAIPCPRQKGPWPKILHTISTYLVLIVCRSSGVALPQKSPQRDSWDNAPKKHGVTLEGDPGRDVAMRGEVMGFNGHVLKRRCQETPLLLGTMLPPVERLLQVNGRSSDELEIDSADP